MTYRRQTHDLPRGLGNPPQCPAVNSTNIQGRCRASPPVPEHGPEMRLWPGVSPKNNPQLGAMKFGSSTLPHSYMTQAPLNRIGSVLFARREGKATTTRRTRDDSSHPARARNRGCHPEIESAESADSTWGGGGDTRLYAARE
jgi:hypothetical protein